MPFFFFLLGAAVGSFINATVLRLGTNSRRARSFCFSCGRTLEARDLIPLWSFFSLGGRCRYCQSRISWHYPLVELLTGAVFAAVAVTHARFASVSFPFFQLSFGDSIIQLLAVLLELAAWSLLIALSVYDIRHKIIPDPMAYGFVGAALGLLLLRLAFSSITHPVLDVAAGPFLALILSTVWWLSRGRAIGLGDAKVVLGFSWFLGGVGAVSALILGFWIGALVALFLLTVKRASRLWQSAPFGLKSRLRALTMKSELPLAPFLVAGLFIVYLTGLDVTGLGALLQ